ncbi:neutral/alkaline non-lysosomal ceramidase N-terminal domain-containing protein [bacterium]|nr:neutral/alkaline non-lysosomal ceramidase N-terminal domain-containing protein [bacterium]
MAKLRISYGEVDITPHFPVDLVGYGNRVNPCLGILDPVFCTFILLESDKKKALLLSFDLLAFGERLRQSLLPHLRRLGFSQEEIFPFATHTHSAPSTGAVPYMGNTYQNWLKDIGKSIANKIKEAMERQEEKKLKVVTGEVDIALNRRTLPGWLPTRKEEGYVEKEFAVLFFDNIPLVNFTCHAVCLGGDNRFISADFPGRARVYLKSFLTTPAVLMANGPAGDQNPKERGIYGLEITGRKLAESVFSVYEKSNEVKADYIDYAHKLQSFPLAEPPSTDWLKDFIKEQEKGIENASLPEQIWRTSYIRWATDTLRKVEEGNYEKVVKGKISLLKIGELLFLFLPGEVFSEIGKKAKELIREKGFMPFVVGYYDKIIGYLPTTSAFEEGGYEVSDAYRWYGYPAPFLPTVEDITLQTVRDLLKKL